MTPRGGAAKRRAAAGRAAALAGAAAVVLSSARARATADAGAPGVEPAAGAFGRAHSACIEHIPEGKERPQIKESFPERGRAGYAATLVVEVPHGLGETVLPGGFRLQLDSPEGRAIQAAGFRIPALDGPAAPRVARSDQDGQAKTSVELPFVPLPKEPGPQRLTLPSVPIAIARPSGELITLCTAPHELAVDDPTSNVAQATPRPNPPPQRQLEVWTAAKNIPLGALIAPPLGPLVALALGWGLRRPKPLPPPPPARPPCEPAPEGLPRVRQTRQVPQALA